MKKIKYIVITIIFSILLGACSTIIGIYQVVTWKPKILVDLDIKAYSIYKDGKFTRDGFKENEIDKLSYKIVDDYGLYLYNGRIGTRGEYSKIIFYDDIKVTLNNKTVVISKDKIKQKKITYVGYVYDYSISPLEFNEFSTEGLIIDLGTIEIVEKDGKIVKEKRKIPPIMLKNTLKIFWLENAFHPDIIDTYYYYWLDKYKGEFGDVKKIYPNPELVKIPNDIKKIIENKKKLSNIEDKVGEEWQGKRITNDTNLSIDTWEKVDK
ncbi:MULTISPECIES: hypothetical protein [Fusobacterium]|uniref:hypothetical protein n=1 Tax=Fusobacterium TaxID=848 RepID=UPI0003F76CD3|nr:MULTISPECIES: hypothetical protein [Fusobacterium]